MTRAAVRCKRESMAAERRFDVGESVVADRDPAPDAAESDLLSAERAVAVGCSSG